MLSGTEELRTSKATVVRPTSLESFQNRTSPAKPLEVRGDCKSGDEIEGLRSTFVGDRLQNQFHSTRSLFETWQPKQAHEQRPKSPVSGNTSPPVPDSPVFERLESFSALKKRFESDANNNNTVPQDVPRATRHSSCGLGTPRQSWASSSSPDSSRRSSASSTEMNEKLRRSSEMSIVRERIVIAKQELAEINERRGVTQRAYADAKRRIQSSKAKSKSLREQIRSLEDIIERKERKTGELTKRLGARTIVIEQNRRAAEYYDRDIRNESELIRSMTEKIEVTRARKKATIERIREIAQRLPPVKAAIEEAEERKDKARSKARRFEDILTKSSIRLKNARTLSADAEKRTSFRGYRLEDVHKKIREQRERSKRAKSDISYLEYRKELITEQLEECKEDVRNIVMRLNPHRQQKALGFTYTRLPMSEEL